MDTGMRWIVPLAAVASLAIAGCGSGGAHPEPIASDAFYRPLGSTPESPLSSVDQPGQLPMNGVNPGPSPSPVSPAPHQPDQDTAPLTQPIETTRPVIPIAAPTTSQSTGPVYMTLGRVVAVVNGTPIYANKIMHLDIDLFRDKARQVGFTQFRAYVESTVMRTIREQISSELLVAAAERNLSDPQKRQARDLTTRWRERQITEAGGSLELARRKATAQGDDFEELVSEQHRIYLTDIFRYELSNRVVVTVDEMRRYYREHEDAFNHPSKADVLILQVNPQDLMADNGGLSRDQAREESIKRAEDFKKRVLNGEDFAKLCAGFNKNKALASTITLQPKSFALKKVDQQIWTLPVGQISDVIEDDRGFYLARVEKRENGRTEPFESEDVQDKIHRAIQNAKVQAAMMEVEQKLQQSESIEQNNDNITTCIQMILENYSQWAAKPQ